MTIPDDDERAEFKAWRVGRKVGRTIYNERDELIGVMDTRELAAEVVGAVNAGAQTDWMGATAFLSAVQGDGQWADEFLAWYVPARWLNEQRACAAFLAAKWEKSKPDGSEEADSI